jgi:hypothetical protein
MDLRRWTPLLALLAIGIAVWWLEGRPAAKPGPSVPGPTRPRSAPPSERPAPRPGPPATQDGIPGGSLVAHEDLGGAHTIERHVGRSVDDLRRRVERESLREASTFPDLATADRAVADVLRARRDAIARWVARGDGGLNDFEARLDRPVGTVYRRDGGRAVEGRTVVVVLARSNRFPEGFRIHTAYVTTP